MKISLAISLLGAIFGAGAFCVVRPGAVSRHAIRLKTYFEQGLFWLITRAQARHRADLAIAGFQASEMVVQKLSAMLIAGVSVLGLAVVSSLLGVDLSFSFVFAIFIAAATLGFFYPDSRVRSLASSRRHDFLHAFSSYLDLVNVLLAGGSGTETALIAAAEAGDGWSFSEIRGALTRARSARRSPWVELAALGGTYNIVELAEVAGSVQLAGEHGARIRSSLSARADSLRNRHMGEIEANAQSATERMGVPMVLLFVAFIALIGYPAIHMVLGSF